MFFSLNGGRSAFKERMEAVECHGGQYWPIIRPSETRMDESDLSQPDFSISHEAKRLVPFLAWIIQTMEGSFLHGGIGRCCALQNRKTQNSSFKHAVCPEA